MSKLCCFDIPEPPTISLNVNCPSSCCESRLQRWQVDLTDCNVQENKDTNSVQDDDEEETVCCCFTRKRHAKVKNSKDSPTHGKET